jgi:hypothetical protein
MTEQKDLMRFASNSLSLRSKDFDGKQKTLMEVEEASSPETRESVTGIYVFSRTKPSLVDFPIMYSKNLALAVCSSFSCVYRSLTRERTLSETDIGANLYLRAYGQLL